MTLLAGLFEVIFTGHLANLNLRNVTSGAGPWNARLERRDLYVFAKFNYQVIQQLQSALQPSPVSVQTPSAVYRQALAYLNGFYTPD
jgi:hypothetical protein